MDIYAERGSGVALLQFLVCFYVRERDLVARFFLERIYFARIGEPAALDQVSDSAGRYFQLDCYLLNC